MEDILKDHGINTSIIQDKIKEKKEKKDKHFDNHKLSCQILEINRTSIYKIYITKKKQETPNIKRY